jgi:hypothetical protein
MKYRNEPCDEEIWSALEVAGCIKLMPPTTVEILVTTVGSSSVAEHHQLPRRIFLAAVMVAVSLCSPPADLLRAQERRAIQGIWSTTFTAPDHPEWKIEDHFCPIACPPIAGQHIRSLLANPANDTRSLQELAQETTRVANQYVAQLMTDAARERRARYDPAADPAIRCEPPGLITLVLAPLPIAIEVHDDKVIIHHDHWNTVRAIRITDQSIPSVAASTRLGSSTARFEGATLIVESRNVAAVSTSADITTTDGTRIVERYTASGNGARLNLELIIDDPASYREPLVLAQSRVRTPDEKILDIPPCEAISGKP